MLFSIFSFLLDIAAGLVGGACLLRLYMQWQRSPFGNPLGQFVMAISNWLVLPLRRVFAGRAGVDWASLIAAYLIELVQFGLLMGVAAMLGSGAVAWAWVPIAALFGLVRLAISGLIGLMLMYAVLSWVQPHSPLFDTLGRLCEPLLRPVRRYVPQPGGVDLSPLAVLVVLQIATMVLASMQGQVMRF
jgi:YggT family protein